MNTARGSVLLNRRSVLIGLCALIQISILSSLVSSIGFTGSGEMSRSHAPRAVTAQTLFPQTQPSQNGTGVGPAIATTRFDLVGLNIASGPITQSVPVNTPTAVTTTLQVPVGSNPQQILAGLNPNYRIRGDLSGPSFAMPRPLEARIGEPLLIPVMSKTGDHRVQNLRVVDTSLPGAPAVAPVSPDACSITVIEQILVSEVKVRELSYDEIVKAGIQVTDTNYQFFNFTLALATTSTAQDISIPVAFPNTRIADPRPLIGTPQIPQNQTLQVPVPDVLPVMLKPLPSGDSDPDFKNGLGPDGQFPAQIPGLIVFPGRVGFLNQFFEAIVIVANGAPDGSPLVLRNLKAKVRLPNNGTPTDPADDPLRIVVTQTGGEVTELELHGLGADEIYGTADDTLSFAPSQSGQAAFLLEGVREGLHTVAFDLEAKLDGLPIGEVTVAGEVTGAVLVRDASFAVTFTHPAVVRAGQEYTLAMTMLNTGSRDIQGAIAQLAANSISGAELIGNDTGSRDFPTTIGRGASGTVTWRLRANTTGQVTASYVKVGSDVSAGLTLTTGVGDRNVPLSPDSLILPEQVKFLPENVVDAARAVLGQAWSVATTPRYILPEGVLPIERQVVVDRAVELGVAGLRVEFGEPTPVSLFTALRDWLGELQTIPDPGLADAVRNTPAGYLWADQLGAQFRATLNSSSQPVTPADFFQTLVETESSRSPLISALISQPEGPPVFGARLSDATGNQVGFGPAETDRFGDFPQGSAFQLAEYDGLGNPTTSRGQFLLVSNPTPDAWNLELSGWRTGTGDLRLALPTGNNAYRQFSFENIAVTPGDRYRVRFLPFQSTTLVLEKLVNGSYQTVSTAVTSIINEPPPRVVGVVQVTSEVLAGGDDFGRVIGVLFSKPMNKAATVALSRYTIGGGELAGSDPVQLVGRQVKATSAQINFGDRLALLALDTPVGPYLRRELTVQNLVDASGFEVSPSPQTLPIQMRVSPQGNPPGGYATGRVLSADGTPVANAPVLYSTVDCGPESFESRMVLVAVQYTDDQGRYTFDYIRNSACGIPSTFEATHPVTSSTKRLSTPIVYDGQKLGLDFVFLARGRIQGRVLTAGVPSPSAFLKIVPALDVAGTKVVQADSQGNYVADDIPVGSVSVQAVAFGTPPQPNGIASGYIESATTPAIVNVNLQPLNGVISGRVVNPNGTPAPGLLAVVYNSPGQPRSPLGFAYGDADGNFRITKLPLQKVYLEVVDYVTGLAVQQPVTLSLSQSTITGVVLTLPGYGTISGRVVDDQNIPVPGVTVLGAGRIEVTDTVGNYVLQGITAGVLQLTSPGNSQFFPGSVTVQVQPGTTVTNATLVVRRKPAPGLIQGYVYQATGVNGTPSPLGGVTVTYDGINPGSYDEDGNFQPLTTVTNAQGFYSMTNVPTTVVHTVRYVKRDEGLAVNLKVEVPPGATLTRDVTFRPVQIQGRVFQPDGVTGTVAQVKLKAPGFDSRPGPAFGLFDPNATPSFTLQTDSAGQFQTGKLNPGPYSASTSNVFFPVKVSRNGFLRPGESANLTFTLVDQLAGKLQGTIFQPDGTTPVGAGVQVTLGGGGLADATVRTDETGHYEFAEVFTDGNYVLTALDPVTGFSNRTRVAMRYNQDAAADLRLLGTGSLRVTVVDGAGIPVSSGTVTLTGTAYPNTSRFTTIPDSSGMVQFDNLPEGSYTLLASRTGLSGRASVTVVRTQTVETVVQLQNAGTVEGRVYLPGGQTPVGLADVKLALGGRVIGFVITSDAEGEVGTFRFEGVPAGNFTLDVFDNRSGRTGRATGRIVQQGEVVTVDVELIALGTVTGQVTANGTPVGSALVSLSSTSNAGFSNLQTTADTDGRFRLTGIPAGQFQVRVVNGPGGLAGSTTGQVPGGVEPLPETVADIALTPSASLTGTVYRAGGMERVPGAEVTITVNNRQFGTNADETGVYRLDWLPLGTASVLAEAPTGIDRGLGSAVLDTAGSTVTTDVMLDGIGTIRGQATANDGSPLNTGTVTFTSTSDRPQVVVIATVQADGSYEFPQVPAGSFSLRLSVPNVIRVGTATGTVTSGGILPIDLQLADAGSVLGRVKRADGVTNAANAKVTLRMTSGANPGVVFIAYTGFQGTFLLDGIPLGSFSIRVEDALTQGVAVVPTASLATNNQTLDLGTLTLDVTPIQVQSVTPTDGTVNAPRTGPITIAFSEPALASTVNGSTLRLLKGTTNVSASVALAGDGLSATLTPTSPLEVLTTYTVVVTTGVTDLVGLALQNEFRSSFTTRDDVPPTVQSLTPANNSRQIAFNTTIQAVFNEALDPAQDLAAVLQFTTDAGQALPGNVVLDGTGKILTFTPASLLAESTFYRATVSGARDLAGNVQTVAANSRFLTVDTTPPTITLFTIGGAPAVEGMQVTTEFPTISASFTDVNSPVSYQMWLGQQGFPLTQVRNGAGSSVAYFPTLALNEGNYTVELRVTDSVGNQQTQTINFTIVLLGPQVLTVTPADGATGVSRTPSIIIEFNQPLKQSTVNSSTIRLLKQFTPVSTVIALSPDRQTVSVSPVSQLDPGTLYTIEVTTGVQDDDNRPLDAIFRASFTTIDNQAPAVVTVSPSNNAVNVALRPTISVTFDEALAAGQTLTEIVKLAPDDTPTQFLSLTASLSGDSRTITAQPTVDLADSTRFVVTITGQRDGTGNTQTTTFTSRFTTLDQTPPVVNPLSIDGTIQFTLQPFISATFFDNLSGIDTNQVVLTLDGVTITTGVNIFGNGLSYTPPDPLTVGPHTVTVQVKDRAGNTSAIRSATFTIDNTPPNITSFTIDGLEAFDGIEINNTLQPEFIIAYTEEGSLNESQSSLAIGLQSETPQPVPVTFEFNQLRYQPPSPFASGVYRVVATLVDGLGNTTTRSITFALSVTEPVIGSVSPATGSQHGGTSVTLQGSRLLNSTGTPPVVLVGNRPAVVKSAVEGPPDQVVIVIPASSPGNAPLQVINDRGTGLADPGFAYTADPRTPFVTEADTRLLWHLDEPQDGQVTLADSGPTGLLTATAFTSSVEGRFGSGRTAPITGDSETESLALENTSFTLATWFKVGAIDRPYTLFGKGDPSGSDSLTAYTLQVLANGGVRGQLFDSADTLWQVESTGVVTTDDQWHQAVLTVDRAGTMVRLSLDGVEVGSANQPAGFGNLRLVESYPVYAGVADTTDDTGNETSPGEFPGILDEIRVSSSAHTGSRIEQLYQGSAGTLGLQVVSVSPRFVVRGELATVRVIGYNLAGATVTVLDPAGTAVQVSSSLTSATEATFQFTIDSGAPLGTAQVTVTSGQGTSTVPLLVLDPNRSRPLVESDTALLWNLDESGDGQLDILDAGSFGITGQSGFASTAQPGRFEGGRAMADITSGSAGPVQFPASDFTVECWVKTGPVGRRFVLAGSSQYQSGYALNVLRSGAVRAELTDSVGLIWKAQVSPSVYHITDNQWHQVLMTVNQTTGQLSLYIDGMVRASATKPVGFGQLFQTGQFLAGVSSSVYDPLDDGPTEFPGTLDAIRVSSTARSAESIQELFDGTSPLRVVTISAREINRDKTGQTTASTQVTLVGTNLDGITADIVRNSTSIGTATVDSATYNQAQVTLSIPPNTTLGPANLVLSKAGQIDSLVPVFIVEHRPFEVDATTRLLWHLDETDNGNLQLQDAGPYNLSGYTSYDSRAVPGRFAGGRRLAGISAGAFNGEFSFGSGAFTIEGWVKTSPVSRSYTLLGLGDSPNQTKLQLLPTGTLIASHQLSTTNPVQLELRRSACQIDDGNWHSLALVTDVTNGRLTLFVDGVERATTSMPGQPVTPDFFSLVAGSASTDDTSGTTGPESFPGILDEIRISDGGRSAAEIAAVVFGPDSPPVVSPVVFSVTEPVLTRGGTTVIGLNGAGLTSATLTTSQNGITVTVQSTSASRLDAEISVGATVPRGPVTFTLTTPAGTTSVTLLVATQQPFADAESDTVLLWHLDEPGEGQRRLYDSGLIGIDGFSSGNSRSVGGRFGTGRTKPGASSIRVADQLDVVSSGFTLETWIKTNPVGQTYTLLGKGATTGEDSQTAYVLQLLPSGLIRAQLFDENGLEWRAEVPASTVDVTDNIWHFLAVTVDRSGNQLRLYVDGTERVAVAMPGGFGTLRTTANEFFAGTWDQAEPVTFGGPPEFPGTLDEIRVSDIARTAQEISNTWLGTDPPSGGTQLSITSLSPDFLTIGEETVIRATGANLENAGVTATDGVGNPLPVEVLTTTATEIQFKITPANGTAIGMADVVISSPAGSVTRNLRLVDVTRIRPAVESDTVLLWRLDEPTNGYLQVEDISPNGIRAQTSASSEAVSGRFAGGRSKADISADSNPILAPGSSSFTLDFWVKTPSVSTPALLAGVGTPSGYFGGSNFSLAYGVELLPTGSLRAVVTDQSQKAMVATLFPTTYQVADDQWHQVVLVMDRQASRLSLVVDGAERAFTPIPSGFGPVEPENSLVIRPLGGSQVTGETVFLQIGPFVGAIDEVRISSTAHPLSRVQSDFQGTSPYRLTSFGVPDLQRTQSGGNAITQLTVEGYDLTGLTAEVRRAGQAFGATTSVTSVGYRQAQVEITVPPATTLGPAQLVLSKAGFADTVFDIAVIEPAAPAVEPETLLLWQLDEPGTGQVTLFDGGPLGLPGTTATASVAESGRFGSGRSLARITAVANARELEFGTTSFTLDTWVKTGPLATDYTLVGKGREFSATFNTELNLRVTSLGKLAGEVVDQAGVVWQSETTLADGRITDNQWHHVTMVVDRQANQLRLYIDGELRSETAMPDGFGSLRLAGYPVFAGFYRGSLPFGEPQEFPGILDGIRISSGVRSAARIAQDYIGSDDPPPATTLSVNKVLPAYVHRGATTALSVRGFGLEGATVSFADSELSATVTQSTAARLELNVTATGSATLGTVQMTITAANSQTTTVPVTVVNQQPFADATASSLLLWHLNETFTGSGTVVSTATGTPVNGSASFNSRPATGRFNGGRELARIQVSNDFGRLTMGSSSFTVEGWFKSFTVNGTYTLAGRSAIWESAFSPTDQMPFGIQLLPSGKLRGRILNASGTSVEVQAETPLADDGTWHYVALVVNRSNGTVKLYLDGTERASSTIPGGFGSLSTTTQLFVAGRIDVFQTNNADAPTEFPGVLDEFRIVNTARTAAEIESTWTGE